MDIVFTDFSGPLNPPVEKVGLAHDGLAEPKPQVIPSPGFRLCE